LHIHIGAAFLGIVVAIHVIGADAGLAAAAGRTAAGRRTARSAAFLARHRNRRGFATLVAAFSREIGG
jgi:hypothetical protein